MAETTGMDHAQTLHSLLELHGEDAGWKKKQELETDLLIVDECSMMDMWLAYQLFSRLRPGTKVLFAACYALCSSPTTTAIIKLVIIFSRQQCCSGESLDI